MHVCMCCKCLCMREHLKTSCLSSSHSLPLFLALDNCAYMRIFCSTTRYVMCVRAYYAFAQFARFCILTHLHIPTQGCLLHSFTLEPPGLTLLSFTIFRPLFYFAFASFCEESSMAFVLVFMYCYATLNYAKET